MASKYDQLNQIPYHITDPRSPIYQQVKAELAPLDAQAAKMDPSSPEFAKFQQMYQQKAASLLLTKLQGTMGGQIPSRKEAEDADYAERSGGDAEKEAVLRKESVATPYSQAFNGLEQLQKLAGAQSVPQATPASLVEPGGAPTKLMPAPSAPPKRPGLPPGASDDAKLSDAQLGMLLGLAQQVSGAAKPGGPDAHVAQTLDEQDSPGIPQAPVMSPTDELAAEYRANMRSQQVDSDGMLGELRNSYKNQDQDLASKAAYLRDLAKSQIR